MTVIRLHQFSPQRSNPDDLETILMARAALLDKAMEKIRNSSVTKNRYHLLFVGQRGIGKTHLIALINRRVEQDKKLRNKVRIAWLNEDETSSRFLHLLIRIYRSLAARYPDEFPIQDVQAVLGLDASEALAKLSNSVVQRAKNHTILLLIENLDAHFAKFSIEEQRNWRGFVQDHPIFTTVATAQGLFDGVKKHDEPFYGFFDTQHLQPLSIEQTSEMLMKIAILQGNEPMQQMLNTPKGQSRLRVIHFLAGGNPRLYVLLSELIADATLDDVVDTFEAMVDQQLTSYYQERLRWLAPLQQDIVQVLCRFRSAVSVKQIAEELFTTNQSVSSQLKELKGFGYVTFTKVGRETWYELAEPLMRLVMQVKETGSHQPLSLLVEFLQAWFDREELERKLGLQEQESTSWRYLESAISTYDQFLKQWPELRRPDVFNWQPRKIEELTEVIDSRKTTVKEKADALFERTLHFMHMGNWHQLVSDCTILFELTSGDDLLERFSFVAIFFRQRGWIVLGEYSKAIDDFSLLSKMKSEKPISKSTIGFFLSTLTWTDASSWEKAIELLLGKCVELRVESELGGALVDSIRVSRLGEKLDKLTDWNAVWQRLGARVPQLIVPLRLLNAGTNYLITKRPEVLLGLPLEEREILKNVLKFADESWTSLDG
jgi:DNA-binding transcriptional ArsR family regulator